MRENCLDIKKQIRETFTQQMAIEDALATKTNPDESPLTVMRLNQLIFEAAKITKKLMVAKDQAKAKAKHLE